MSLTAQIKERAVELGFDLVGVAPAGRAPTADSYETWLDNGYHASMRWMENVERRSDPRAVVENAKSVVVVGISYFVQDPPTEIWNDPTRGRIARYAWGPDYHDVMTPRLKELASFIRQEAGTGAEARYYVDTGPVLERAFAAHAGLGFVGKNSLVICPDRGSFVFLAEVLVNRELDYDAGASPDPSVLPFVDEHGHAKEASCGSCRRCLDICPTHAFPAPYVLDSNLCISYLTIELKEAIPEALRPKMGNWLYGCDACQSVCPWVKRYSAPAAAPFLAYDPDRAAPRLEELLRLDEAAFRERFKGTPMKRTKRRGLLRNAAVALGNSGDRSALPVLREAMDDPEPLVREHAAWAVGHIEGQD